MIAGIRCVLRNPTMRASLLATATINLFNFIFWALFILYAVRALDVARERSASSSARVLSAA